MIDIKATGLGYVDALMVAGLYQIKPPLPFIPGNEIAGVICEVGTDVTQFNVGDRVLAMPSRGGLAEKIAVRADTCIPIPDRASFEAAAAFLVNYCTAYHGLITLGQVKAGESVLILGQAAGLEPPPLILRNRREPLSSPPHPARQSLTWRVARALIS